MIHHDNPHRSGVLTPHAVITHPSRGRLTVVLSVYVYVYVSNLKTFEIEESALPAPGNPQE